jgi:hypothetical protein
MGRESIADVRAERISRCGPSSRSRTADGGTDQSSIVETFLDNPVTGGGSLSLNTATLLESLLA